MGWDNSSESKVLDIQTQDLNPNLTPILKSLKWWHAFVISELRRWGQTADPWGVMGS